MTTDRPSEYWDDALKACRPRFKNRIVVYRRTAA